jgi:hypothetical protein
MTYPDSYRRILNRMGYYDYQNGLIYRHLNQEGRWDSHLQNCRSFILKAVYQFRPDTVTVLGSGWLLDLPLAEIVEMNISIRLVDIVHPPEVRQQVAQFSGIELCEEDVTGGLISEVWKKAGNRFLFNKLKSISSISVPDYNPSRDPGMVVSLNILTQLESLPLSFLEKHTTLQKEELLGFRKTIQEKHLVFLEKHPSVLITDISEVVTEKSGLVSTVPNLLVDLPDGKYCEEWIWDFDLTGTDYYNRKSILKMKAVII